MQGPASFGVVIVNYNSAALALQAARSALGAQSPNGATKIVIVDNGSPDNSRSIFRKTLEEKKGPPIKGPDLVEEVSLAEFSNIHPAIAQVESSKTGQSSLIPVSGDMEKANLVILENPQNKGFAAGNNIGLQFLGTRNCSHFLLLNPDAVLERGALMAFANCLENPQIGLAGATLLSITPPWPVQAYGGARLCPLTLLGRNIGGAKDHGKNIVTLHKRARTRIDYPVGAAMAFRRDWLDHVGPMDERYFLYYEEIDWVTAGANRYRPVWAEGAIAYHHHGASIGSNLGHKTRSALADYHMIRSRLLFAMKWRPYMLPVLWAIAGAQFIRRLFRGQHDQARAIIKASLPR